MDFARLAQYFTLDVLSKGRIRHGLWLPRGQRRPI
jgi:hypothetical protein